MWNRQVGAFWPLNFSPNRPSSHVLLGQFPGGKHRKAVGSIFLKTTTSASFASLSSLPRLLVFLTLIHLFVQQEPLENDLFFSYQDHAHPSHPTLTTAPSS